MITIDIKPFSINAAWQGKRYKTQNYKIWRNEFAVCSYGQLKEIEKFTGYVEIHYAFFISHYKKSDVDNFVKTTSDALVENGIIEDDRFVKKYVIEKFMLNDLDEPRIEIDIFPWHEDHYKFHHKVKTHV